MSSTANVRSFPKPVVTKSIFLAIVLALIVTLSVAQVQAKATTVTTNESIDIEFLVFVPCAAGGAGEFVQLSGPLHFLFVTTIDDRGGFHSKFHNQPQGISGTGLTTGAKYQATGVTQGTFHGTVGSTETYVNNFRIIGQRPGGSFLVHETFHFTVNANGEVTAVVDNFRVECKAAGYPG